MIETFILATGLGEADKVYGAIDSLAREILRRRGEVGGGAIDLRFVDADLQRPPPAISGPCVAVRALDGREGGHGTLIGYAFMGAQHHPREALMAAVAARKAPGQLTARSDAA
jgi:hypothetical protein